jgi:hypothetical protein
MDFSFYVPFFCTAAAAAATAILNGCFVNIEFCESKKLILNLTWPTGIVRFLQIFINFY